MKAKDITITALLAAVICALSPFTLPLGAVPVTLATLAIYFVSAVGGAKKGVAAVAIFILLGVAGVPVFSGFQGGFDKLIGPTGGFIAGYLPLSLIVGLAADKFPTKKAAYPLSMFIGTLVLYALGALWLAYSSGNSVGNALLLSVLPFLPIDTLKIAAASFLAYKLKANLANTPRNAK